MSYSISSYDFQKSPWYSPWYVLQAVHKLSKKYPGKIENHRDFKLAREMFQSAIALLGAYHLHNDNKYLMQANIQSSSPDVVAVKLTESKEQPVNLEVTQLEVVTMEEHSPENDVVDFLARTKLSDKKAYNEYTLILCVINKKIQINKQEIEEKLSNIKPAPKSTIYILGKMPNDIDKWVVFSPHPMPIKPVIFSSGETVKEYSLPDAVTLRRGLRRNIVYEKSETTVVTIEDFFHIPNK